MATISERIAKAKAAADAAVALVSTPEFEAEERERRELAEHEARALEARNRARDMLVARMLDDAPDGAEAVIIRELPHIFVVTAAGAAAYRAFNQGLFDAAADKIRKGTREKVIREDVVRVYAVAGTLKWNRDGEELDLEESENGKALHDFFRANPAVASQVSEAVGRLDGADAEVRKR